jgi:hypothetical protein
MVRVNSKLRGENTGARGRVSRKTGICPFFRNAIAYSLLSPLLVLRERVRVRVFRIRLKHLRSPYFSPHARYSGGRVGEGFFTNVPTHSIARVVQFETK